jgi:hypothetical protein
VKLRTTFFRLKCSERDYTPRIFYRGQSVSNVKKYPWVHPDFLIMSQYIQRKNLNLLNR